MFAVSVIVSTPLPTFRRLAASPTLPLSSPDRRRCVADELYHSCRFLSCCARVFRPVFHGVQSGRFHPGLKRSCSLRILLLPPPAICHFLRSSFFCRSVPFSCLSSPASARFISCSWHALRMILASAPTTLHVNLSVLRHARQMQPEVGET